MSDMNEIVEMIEKEAKAGQEFRTAQITRLDALEKETTALAKKMGRPFAPDGAAAPAATHETWIDLKSKKAIPVLRHDEKLAALETKAASQPSLGRVLRGIVLGGAAHDARELEDERKAANIFSDPSGGYTVSGALSGEWIDLLRAQMVLSKAGARTLPLDAGQVNIARVTADPTISWHGESVALPEAEPTFGKVTLNAKTCVCLVKLSLELSQDSANIETILQTTITNAMAGAIDSVGLNGVTVDAAAAPGGLFNLAGINALSTVGAPTSWDFVVDAMYELMLDNVAAENIGALVGHPAIWKKLRKLKTGISSDLTSLVPPPEVAALPKLWTTAAPFTAGTTCSAIIGDWRDLIFGVRKDITVTVLREAFMGSNLQIAVLAYSRVDFAATRATSFCVMPGITI
jgi:HK97 family phage major capsid protein